ncbi:uncharacterized protein BDR25DRAFT_384230 [Lindgomyces ingoldianus]|uniref:Uncharacterized protein n=1 Tax=Lindgomyces ingoldianus TaxID=673940 RepID=A0ACB6R6E9_9PLEO|nr:uncharacterized protein BDR25DRAFT_384230 [Lindgomyces ingoldianus]KAF2474839.1 hypothetical protein BDR25DRAFT_384230 [Lindgomyces ingoldianus]
MTRANSVIPPLPTAKPKNSGPLSPTVASSPNRVRGFLGLPGELRNRIYDFYFEEDFRVEIVAKDTKFTTKVARTMKLCPGVANRDTICKHQVKLSCKEGNPATLRMPRKLGCYRRVEGVRTIWANSLCALILVNKQVFNEAIPFLYQNTTFVYDAPQRIRSFLKVVPVVNLSAITKLYLHYTTYGGPSYMQHLVWQGKHLASWASACKAISKTLSGLEELQIWLRVNDTPLYFDLRQRWVQPLLQFRRLTCPRNVIVQKPHRSSLDQPRRSVPRLKVVHIHFTTHWSSHTVFPGNSRLADASMDLHDLFAEGISRAILGSNEEEAMTDFREAWEGKHAAWQHHLNYSNTGW